MAKRTPAPVPVLLDDVEGIQFLLIPRGALIPSKGLRQYRDGRPLSDGHPRYWLNYYGWTVWDEKVKDNLRGWLNTNNATAPEDLFVITLDEVVPRKNELGDICP